MGVSLVCEYTQNKVFLKIKERILPETFILQIKKKIQEEGRWMPLFDLDLKILQILPQRIMLMPVPDNIYLNMLTRWKQEMRSVLELCCKMTQSQRKQGSSARTPVQTPSQFYAKRIQGIDCSYKSTDRWLSVLCTQYATGQQCSAIQLVTVISSYNALNQKGKAQPRIYCTRNYSSQQLYLNKLYLKMGTRAQCLSFSFISPVSIKIKIENHFQISTDAFFFTCQTLGNTC